MGIARELDRLSPDLIVHAAALTNVDRCEEAPVEARRVNAEIAQNVALASARKNVSLIHVSTDHLFGGDGSFYLEDDPPQPLNEYGRSKLLAEKLVQDVCPRVLILRTNFFGWGFAQRQSFSDWIIYNLRAEKQLTLFDDVYFTPILADDLAAAAHELIERGCSGIFNLVGDERVSKYDFALRLADRFALPPGLIQHGAMHGNGSAAVRPRDMSLNNTKARDVLGRGLGTILDFQDALYAQEINGRRSELFDAVK